MKTIRRKTWRATQLPESICSAAHRLMRKGPLVLLGTGFRKKTCGNDRNYLQMEKEFNTSCDQSRNRVLAIVWSTVRKTCVPRADFD